MSRHDLVKDQLNAIQNPINRLLDRSLAMIGKGRVSSIGARISWDCLATNRKDVESRLSYVMLKLAKTKQLYGWLVYKLIHWYSKIRSIITGRGKNIKEHKNVQDIIDECLKKAEDGDYIFRGTSCTCVLRGETIQSSLYRLLAANKLINPNFDLIEIEKDKVSRARYLFGHNDTELQILTELRHYDDALTIIDFTRNLFVALFFACGNTLNVQGKKNSTGDGEVVLLKMPEIKSQIDYDAKNFYAIEPATDKASYNRVRAQSSIFIHAKNGFIVPNDPNDSSTKTHTIRIEKDLKMELLEYLRESYNIEPQTIFNDVIGFIDSEKRSNPFDYYRGMIALEEGKFKKAFTIFDKIVKNNSQSYGALNSRGVALSKQRKTERAIDDYTKAIQLNPDYDLPYFNRAQARLVKGDTDKALLDFDKCLEINPKDILTYLSRAGIYNSQNKFKEELQELSRALEIDCNFADALALRVRVNLALDRNINAEKDLESFLNTNPHPINAHLLLGFYYCHLKNYQKGFEEYNEVISMDSKNIQAHIDIGTAKCEIRDYEGAINDFDIAIDLLNLAPEIKLGSLSIALSQRGQAKLNCDKLVDGITDLSEALKANPNDRQINNNRGLAYFVVAKEWEIQKNMEKAMQNYNYALVDFNKAIELNPDIIEIHDHRAKVYAAIENLKV